MRNCFMVIRNNFKRSCNRPIYFTVNLIIPIIVVILGIFANSVSQPRFTIGVIYQLSAADVVDTLSNTKGITVAKANPNTAKIDLITGKYSAIIDFSKSDYTLYSLKNKQTNLKIKQVIDAYKLTSTPINLEEIMETSISLAVRTISFIVLFLMVTATVTASLMIKDKNNGTLKRYRYSPQRPIIYILGNSIYNYLITFFQFWVCITFVKLTGIDIGISYLNLVLMGFWLSGIATSFGTFISSVFKKEMYANLFSSCIALMLSLIGGSFISYDNMPALLQKISIISPLRWFNDITKNLENGVNWFKNEPQILILSLEIILLTAAAYYMNRKSKVTV